MTSDSLGQLLNAGDWVTFPVSVGGTALMRYGVVESFGTSRRDRPNTQTIRVLAAYKDYDGVSGFGSLGRAYSVCPDRCMKMNYVPEQLRQVIK